MAEWKIGQPVALDGRDDEFGRIAGFSGDGWRVAIRTASGQVVECAMRKVHPIDA